MLILTKLWWDEFKWDSNSTCDIKNILQNWTFDMFYCIYIILRRKGCYQRNLNLNANIHGPHTTLKTTLDNPNGALEFKGKYVNMQRMNIT